MGHNIFLASFDGRQVMIALSLLVAFGCSFGKNLENPEGSGQVMEIIGQVERIEVSPQPSTPPKPPLNYLVTANLMFSEETKGKFSEPVIVFRVHSPAHDHLEVGKWYEFRLNQNEKGYQVVDYALDEAWNGQEKIPLKVGKSTIDITLKDLIEIRDALVEYLDTWDGPVKERDDLLREMSMLL